MCAASTLHRENVTRTEHNTAHQLIEKIGQHPTFCVIFCQWRKKLGEDPDRRKEKKEWNERIRKSPTKTISVKLKEGEGEVGRSVGLVDKALGKGLTRAV